MLFSSCIWIRPKKSFHNFVLPRNIMYILKKNVSWKRPYLRNFYFEIKFLELCIFCYILYNASSKPTFTYSHLDLKISLILSEFQNFISISESILHSWRSLFILAINSFASTDPGDFTHSSFFWWKIWNIYGDECGR